MHRVDDFANVADTCARGRVHLHHVNVAAFHNGAAMFAFAARFGCGAAVAVFANTVHALGNDPRCSGLPGAADARHDEGLRDPVRVKGVFQRAHHGVLADQIGKGLGAIFAGENLIAGGLSAVVAHVLPLDSKIKATLRSEARRVYRIGAAWDLIHAIRKARAGGRLVFSKPRASFL